MWHAAVPTEAQLSLGKDFIERLACPKCHGPVVETADGGLACRACVLYFPVVDGIPNMILDEAKPLAEGGAR